MRELFATREPSFEVVAEAATAQDAWRLADQQRPDVTIMDVFLRGESGISATRELCRRQRGARVLILSAIDNPSFVREAFAAGARGYALKEQTADEIISAVRMVAGGTRYLPPRFDPELLVTASRRRRRTALFGQLSAREREIFNLSWPATATSGSRPSCSSASRPSRRIARGSTASWACIRASSWSASPRCTAACRPGTRRIGAGRAIRLET